MAKKIMYEIEVGQKEKYPNDNSFCFRKSFRKKNDANYWAQLLSDFFHESKQKLFITVRQVLTVDGQPQDKLMVKKWATKDYLEEKEKRGLE